MFFQRTDPLPCGEADLVSLRVSLNAPVVATDVAAPSPARAAIAVQRGALPGLSVSVAVRPLDATGGALVFRPDPSTEEAESISALIEAALSFGESMGFLFDDDELEGADREKRRRATARWNDFLAGAAFGLSRRDTKPAPPPVVEPPSFDSDATIDLEAATIELGEEVVDPGPDLDPPPAADPAPAAPSALESIAAAAAATVAPSPPLSKFRRVAREAARPAPAAIETPPPTMPTAPAKDADATAPPDSDASARRARGRAPLARLQLVKRSGGESRTRWLQRLLGSF